MNEQTITIRGVLGWGNRKAGMEAYGPGGRWGGGEGEGRGEGDLLGDALERAGAGEGATLVVAALPRFSTPGQIEATEAALGGAVNAHVGPRPFVLQRTEDVSGVSGTGIVAEGVEFSDGTVALQWTSEWPTSVVFHRRGVESVRAVHGHNGKTEIVWTGSNIVSEPPEGPSRVIASDLLGMNPLPKRIEDIDGSRCSVKPARNEAGTVLAVGVMLPMPGYPWRWYAPDDEIEVTW
jgi:hypothetical protein